MDYEYFEKEKNLFVKRQTFFPTSSSPLCAAASFINSYLAIFNPDLHPLNVTSGYTNSATPLYPKETPSKIVMGV